MTCALMNIYRKSCSSFSPVHVTFRRCAATKIVGGSQPVLTVPGITWIRRLSLSQRHPDSRQMFGGRWHHV